MLDVVILEAAQNVDDRVDFADIAQELVAEAFALTRPLNQACDIDEGKLGGDGLGRLRDFRDLVQPFVRHRDLADIGLNRAEGVIRGLCGLRFGQGIEKGGLADIRQADDPAAETHRKLR